MLSYASIVWRRGSQNENQPYMKGPEEVVQWLHRCYSRETNWQCISSVVWSRGALGADVP